MFQGQHIYIKYYIPKPSLSASCTVFTPTTSIPFGGVHPSKLFFEQIILLKPNLAASLTRCSILETRLISPVNPKIGRASCRERGRDWAVAVSDSTQSEPIRTGKSRQS